MNATLRLLGAQALLGTARRAPEFPVADTPPGRLLRDLAGAAGDGSADPEAAARLLLRGAGVLTLCARAGYVPPAAGEGDAAPPVCPAESRAVLSEGSPAVDLCRDIFGGRLVRLQWEAMTYLAERGMVLPPSLLAPALNMGRWSSAVRPMLARVIGERGLWLAALNPDWNLFATSAAGEPDPDAWEHGRPAQRQAYFQAVRERDPARARELFEQDMNAMDATERNALLDLFSIGLSMEDEDLLERLLRRDRGREVRRTAAALLARLPESRLVARMGERLLACMEEGADPSAREASRAGSLTGGLRRAASGLFRRLKAEKTEPFAPPETFDPAWAADLVSEKSPHKRFGPRAWWLYQMAAGVPLSWWTEHSGKRPADLLALAARSEWKDALLTAWIDVLRRAPNSEWARALLESGQGDGAHPGGGKSARFDLVAMLPPEEQEAERIRRVTPETLGELLNGPHAPADPGYRMSPELADRAVAAARARLTATGRDYGMTSLLRELALVLPVDRLDAAARVLGEAAGTSGDASPRYGEALGEFSALALRRRTLRACFS